MFTRHTIAFSCLGWLLWGTSLPAQAIVGADPATGDLSGSVYNAAAPLAGLDGGYFFFQGDFGERPGMPGNFFSTGAIAPIQVFGPNQALVVDGQIWVHDSRDVGGNIGLNNRWLIDPWGSIIGLNSFLTWDHSDNGSFMRQFSVGGEWQTEYVQVTGNYYLPWNDDPKTFGPIIPSLACIQEGNGFFFLDQIRADQQLMGGDIEAGVHIPRLDWISVFAGAYFWEADLLPEDINGVSGRVNFDLNSVQLGVQVYDDNYFGSSVNANASLLLGAGPITITPRKKELYARMYDRTRRRNRIAAHETLLDVKTAAINPNTGLPYNVTVVDNTNAVAGTGTFENPFNNLSLASGSAADIIFVRRGTTSLVNPLAGGTGLVLNDDQIVVGEGTPFALPAANRPGALCVLSTAGINPFVTANAGASVITLADNNQIIGLNILSPNGGNMISGSNLDSFTILNINQNNGGPTGPGAGIVLTNASGIGVIDNFNFFNPGLVAPGGVVIRNTNSPVLDLTLTDANIRGGLSGVELRGNNSDINAILNNVQNRDSGTGLNLRATNGGNVDATVTNSNFLNSVTHGFNLVGNTNGNVVLSGNNLTVNGAGQDALHTVLNDGTAVVTLTNSNFSNAGDDSIDGSLTNGSSLTITTNNVNGLNAGNDAIVLDLDQASQATLNLTQGSFNNAGGDAIDATLDNASQLTINTFGILFQNAGNDGAAASDGHGLKVLANANSQFDGTFVQSSFENAQDGNGMGITLTNNSIGNLNLNNTGAERADENALFFSADDNSTFTANMTNFIGLNDAGLSAIKGHLSNNSIANITGSQVTGFGAGGDAVQFELGTNSQLTMNMVNSGSFANAGGDGIDVTTDGASTAAITFAGGANFSGANGHGLVASASNGSTNTFSLPDGASFDGSGHNAIKLSSLTNSSTNFNGTGVSGANAGLHAIELTAENTSTITFDLLDVGSFTNPGGDGLRLTANTGSTLDVNVAGTGVGTSGLFDQAVNGVLANVTDSTLRLDLTNLNFDNATNYGFRLNADNSPSTVNLTDVTFNGAGNDAINIAASNTETTTVTATRVSGAGAGGDGIQLEADGATLNFTSTETGSFSNPGVDGLRLIASNTANLNVNVNGAGGAGLFDQARNGVFGTITDSNLNLILNNLDFSNATGRGLVINATNSLVGGSIADTTFEGAGLDGMLFNFNNTDTNGTYVLNNVNASNNGGRGLGIVASNTSVADFNLISLDLDNSGNDALQVNSNNSDVTVTGTNIRGRNAGRDGIALIASNGGVGANVTLSGIVNFDNATQDAISLTGNNGDLDLTINTTTGSFVNAGGHAINAVITNGSDLTFDLQGTAGNLMNFTGAEFNGINIISTASVFDGDVNFADFRPFGATTDNGINVFATSNTALSTLDALNSNFNNMLVDGLHAEGFVSGTTTINVTGSSFLFPGDQQQDVNANPASVINVIP